jgi:hypothetical protein
MHMTGAAAARLRFGLTQEGPMAQGRNRELTTLVTENLAKSPQIHDIVDRYV